MKQIKLEYENGKYYADVDITVEEWKKLLVQAISELNLVEGDYENSNDVLTTEKELRKIINKNKIK